MELNIGLIGAGGFAVFAIKAFSKVPGIKVVAVMDVNETAAQKIAEEFDLKIYEKRYPSRVLRNPGQMRLRQ
jgi:predicted dehydrogenase